MSLRKSAIDAFRARVDATLRDLFPCTLRVGTVLVEASGPGGKALMDFVEAGQSPEWRFSFRVPAESVPAGFVVGQAVDWIVSPTETLKLEVFEPSKRPHEDHWQITCRHRRRA